MVAPLRSHGHGGGPEGSHVTPGDQSDGSPGIVGGPSTAVAAAPSDVIGSARRTTKSSNLVALSAVLDQAGVTVVCAQSGKQALRYLLSDTFAVILLDVNMPGMDGFETAELIRRREASADTPIIFVTAPCRRHPLSRVTRCARWTIF